MFWTVFIFELIKCETAWLVYITFCGMIIVYVYQTKNSECLTVALKLTLKIKHFLFLFKDIHNVPYFQKCNLPFFSFPFIYIYMVNIKEPVILSKELGLNFTAGGTILNPQPRDWWVQINPDSHSLSNLPPLMSVYTYVKKYTLKCKGHLCIMETQTLLTNNNDHKSQKKVKWFWFSHSLNAKAQQTQCASVAVH